MSEKSQKWVLTILEVKGIQEYVFRSNELRENIGASEVVRRVTQEEVYALLDQQHKAKHNLISEKPDPNKTMENGGLTAELLYAGGGNTAILFQSKAEAHTFIYELSKMVLQTYPGVQLLAAHVDIAWEQDSLAAKLGDAKQKLNEVRARVGFPSPLLGVSVTAVCNSTELPANYIHPKKKGADNLYGVQPLVSAEVNAKYKASDQAETRLRDLVNIDPYSWTTELDNIGQDTRKAREESYIAIMHADGNAMGQRFMALANRFKGKPISGVTNRQYIKAYRRLSARVDEAASEALRQTIVYLRDWLAYEDQKNPDRPTTKIFPFRPILFGGDDVTWVCRGDLGLALAHHYLTQLQAQTLPTLKSLLEDTAGESQGDPLYACAGVTISKTHYPFARAYALSEELCQEAKTRVKEFPELNKQAAAIDWHITSTGLQGDIETIREREYRTADGMYQLEARPLLCSHEDKTWRNWDNFQQALTLFSNKWVDSHNKVMALREAVRGGPTGVKQFATVRADHQLPLLTSTAGKPLGQDGFADGRCLYFDAIEALSQFEWLVQPEETKEDTHV